MRKRTVFRIAFQITLLAVLVVTIIGIPPNNASASAFSIGDTVEVYNTGSSGLLVRDAPCGNKIGGKFDGSQGVVLAGPVFCESHNRWQIRWGDGLQGWSAENWLKKVSATPDSTPPTVNSLNVSPSSVNLGNSFTISCSVSDSGGSSLNRIELWRANDSGGSPVSWGEIQRNGASGSSSSTSFSDTPSAGTYWYGIHVVDNAGNWGAESSPVKRTVIAADTTNPDAVFWLTKVILSEASIGNQTEQICVGQTILNRLRDGRYGDNIEKVAKGQGNLNGGFAWDQGPKTVSEEQAWLESQNSYIKSVWSDIKTLAQELLDGKHPDPTGGALYFFSPIHMQKGYGPYEIPGTGKTALIPDWALPEGYNKTSPPPSDWKMVDFYMTIPYSASGKLEWIGGLNNVRNYYFMFYRPSRTMPSALLSKTCAAGQFRTEYYNNRFLSGSPVFTQCESDINYDWGWVGPGNGVGNDNFSVCWTGRFSFDTGNYTFRARADDGIKVWVDGDLIINEWKDQPAMEYKQERSISAGEHEVKVEYYENAGRAVAEVWWWRVLKQSDETYYWSNPTIAERGGLIVPKELFPEGNEAVIPIHVPPVIDDSNLIREDSGWETVKEIRRTKLDFDWAKFISSFSLESASTPEGTIFSAIAGFIKSVSSAASICDLKIKIEKDFESNFRAIVEVHDPNRSYFVRQYAGQNLAIPNSGDNIIRSAFSKWLASVFGLEPDRFPQMYYMMSLSIDRAHRDDECVAYLSMSEQGQVIITPKVYQNDRLRIVRIYEILFIPYRLEAIVDVTGDELLSLWEQPLPGQSSGSMLEVLAPIRRSAK